MAGKRDVIELASAPALLCSLAGDAKPGADFGPGVASGSQAVDGLLDGVVDVVGQADPLGTLLGQVGRPADARPVTEEAVAAYRELAAASPDRYRPYLARSLSMFALVLTASGRDEEAAAAWAEAEALLAAVQ